MWIWILYFYLLFAPGNCFRAVEGEVIDILLKGYNINARPVENTTQTVDVWVDLHMQTLQEVYWLDPRLSWNSSNYGDTKEIVIHHKNIWTPDIIVLNSATETYGSLQNDNFRVQIKHNGNVELWVAGSMKVFCVIDLTYFPFDSQACYFHLNSWSYDSRFITLHRKYDVITLRNKHHPQWSVTHTNTSSEIIITDEDGSLYQSLIFSVYLNRKPEFYVNTIVATCTILSLLALLMFCLPPDEGEKVSLGITVLLSFTVFQLLIADIMPRTSEQVPLLSIYLTAVMALTSISLMLTVSVIRMHHKDHVTPLPKSFRFLTFNVASKIVCRRTDVRRMLKKHSVHHFRDESGTHQKNPEMTNSVNADGEQENEQVNSSSSTEEWTLAAHIWDRLFLAMCLFGLAFISSIILVFVPLNRPTKVEPERIS